MRILLLIIFTLASFSTHAVLLHDSYPKKYVVKHGDTLWSIANQYLKKPWEWKSLWRANPQIKNPNRLYPGAILVLDFYKSTPYLKVLSNGTIKLSPAMRPMPLENAVPPIHLSDIKPFLNSSLIIDHDFLVNAPYVLAYSGERLLGGQGDEIYVKNLKPNPQLPAGVTISYALFRQGGPYIDPINDQILGYKASLVGYGELLRKGEPATLLLTTINEGIRLGDRVMPNNQPEFNLYFEPQAPSMPVTGSIIELPGDYTQGATGLVAVLNRGQDAALKPGDVLGVFSKARVVRDPVDLNQTVTLPKERIGEVMVFRSFSHTSFALVVRSIRTIHLGDTVGNP